MITIEELYNASAEVLLQTEARGDGHHFFGDSVLGSYTTTTYHNYSHTEEVVVSEHLGLLQQRKSLIYIQMRDLVPIGEFAVLLAYPRNLAENSFDMENLINILGGPPDPDTLMAFNTARLVDPNEPWLAAIFESLREHAS